MDLFQIVAAGIIMALAVVVGAALAALWHSSSGSNAREERRVPSRPPERQSKGPTSQVKPLGSSARPARSIGTEKREAAQEWVDRTAEVGRLVQDRARIQAAITKGDAKALYELASEYEKLGFHHAANELSQKAKWLGLSGQVAEHVGPSQRQGGSASNEVSKRSARARSVKPQE